MWWCAASPASRGSGSTVRTWRFEACPCTTPWPAPARWSRSPGPRCWQQLEIGTGSLDLEPIDATGFERSEIASFKDALVRRKQEQGLYSRAPAPINFIGDKLFRTTLVFPANVPPGIYQVQVFDLQGGFAADAQRSTLVVSKVGLEADIYDFAQHRGWLYGLTAIAMAILSGWLAGVIFRRG